MAHKPIAHSQKKWVAHGFISTFDPYIFSLHVIGIIAWILGATPGYTWLAIYFIILLYYIKRYMDKREIVKLIYEHFDHTEKKLLLHRQRSKIYGELPSLRKTFTMLVK